jgi:hypothetical protein
MEKVKIKQVEPCFAKELEVPLKDTLKKLGYSIPENSRLRVSLLQADGRKKRSTAGAHTWTPGSERMEVWLEQSQVEEVESREEVSGRGEDVSLSDSARSESTRSVSIRASASPSAHGAGVPVHPAEAELLKALHRAESTPGWNFVSLKKFRDETLPREDIQFLRSDIERQDALRAAIERRLILTSKIQNPKAPQFPVTSIRLNRMMREVQEVLGESKRDLDFHPIRIKGEPLSETVLRERR